MFPFPSIIEAEKIRNRCLDGDCSTRWILIVLVCVVIAVLAVSQTAVNDRQLWLITTLPMVAGLGLVLALTLESRAQDAMKKDPRCFMIGTSKEWEESLEALRCLIESLSGAPIPKAYTEQWCNEAFSLLQKLDDSLKEKPLGRGAPGDPTIDSLIAGFNRLALTSSDEALKKIGNYEDIRRVLGRPHEIPEA